MVATVVIGAGSAGLSVAAALQRVGVSATILERGNGVGESWRRRHEDLHLNTTRRTSQLAGLPIPPSSTQWVSRDEYVSYLERFAAHHELDVRRGVEVCAIERVDGSWRVPTTAGAFTADHVVVATGRERVPRIPAWAMSDVGGRVVHVGDVTRASNYRDQSVLLVGAGNSGVEMAAHLVDSGVSALWVSVRTPPNIVPRDIKGVPLQSVSRALRFLPEPARDLVAKSVARWAFGDLAPYGLPAARTGPYKRLRDTGVTVAIDQGFVSHLKARRLQIVTEVERLRGPDVILADGRCLRPDVIMLATGYEPGLQHLVGHLGVLDAQGMPMTSRTADPRRTGLWFVGFRPSLDGNLRRHPIEARRIARGIARTSNGGAPARSLAAEVVGAVPVNT